MRRPHPWHGPSPGRDLPTWSETSARFARVSHFRTPATHPHGTAHRQDATFPLGVKHRLVRLGFDLAEAVHAAHVMNAIHDGAPGVLGKPVPIIESRVTSSASCCSPQPSVPSGRIGSTRKRVSAVESQTLISVSLGRLTPKSERTPRGSLTARDR